MGSPFLKILVPKIGNSKLVTLLNTGIGSYKRWKLIIHKVRFLYEPFLFMYALMSYSYLCIYLDAWDWFSQLMALLLYGLFRGNLSVHFCILILHRC